MEKVCTLWLVNDNTLTNIKITNEEKLIPKKKSEKMEVEESSHPNRENGIVNEDSSDLVIMGDEPSPEIEIIEVKKRSTVVGEEVLRYEPPKKKQKLDE